MTQRALLPSELGEVIAYTGGLWTRLLRFLENPKILLDTNDLELVGQLRSPLPASALPAR